MLYIDLKITTRIVIKLFLLCSLGTRRRFYRAIKKYKGLGYATENTEEPSTDSLLYNTAVVKTDQFSYKLIGENQFVYFTGESAHLVKKNLK